MSETSTAAVFLGASEMAARCRAFDWAATPLGPVDDWPQSLRTAAGLVLASAFPMILLWGPELVQLYNDGYREVMGAKHPGGLGQPTQACWPEVWHINAPIYDRVRAGETVWHEEALYPLLRRGPDAPPDDVYITVSFSPVPDETGSAGGVLVTLQEVTAQVMGRAAEAERARLAAALEAERTGLLEEVFRRAPSFLHVLRGPDFVFELANESYYQLVGRHDLLGRAAFEALPEAAAGGFPERLARVMATREAFVGRELPVTLARTSGAPPEERLIDLVYLPLVDADGTCTRVLGHGTDVTDYVHARRQTEAALRESGAKYRAVFAALDQGFCILELLFDASDRPVDYRFLETNPAFEQQTGLVGAVGRTARELVPDLEAHWFETYGRVARTGEPTRFQSGSDAMGRWFDVYAFRVGWPEERRIALHFTDVTATKTAERERERLLAELEVERARLAQVFEQAPAFLAVLRGSAHVFERVNAAYYQLVGHREILGRPALDALPEVRGQGFAELLDGVLATGVPWTGREVPILLARTRGAPPEERFLDFTYLPLVEGDGAGAVTRAGVIAHGTDVTAQVLARREVERLLTESERARAEAEAARIEAEVVGRTAEAERARATEANAAKSQFLANMSHELRTPLNAIGGYVQLLELGLHGPVTDEQRTALGRVQRAQHRLLGLINDVLNYAKLESGRVEYALDAVDVRAVVADVAPLVEPQLAAKGLALEVRLPDGPCEVWTDREKLGQVLANLLSNAVKFTDARQSATGAPGRVVIDIATRPGAAASMDAVFLRVHDTGRGIPRDKQDAIFEPFVQVQTGYARGTEGTGLGLAISRDLARGMGGDLRVRSVEGEGSTFTVTLRRVAGSAGTPA